MNISDYAKINWLYRIIIILILVIGVCRNFSFSQNSSENILSYTINLKQQVLKFYWKDDKGNIFKSIRSLKNWLNKRNENLVFSMNGGMFNIDNSPHGLYIENFKKIIELDTLSGNGNFYLKPNGVFYITDNNKPFICITKEFKNIQHIKYATQSGPMLVIDGKINNQFIKGSNNLNIRNGVGILPNHKVVFAMSKQEINFYDFASYFKNLGCKNALYLDGFISQTYLPEKKWIQLGGNFGVIIAVVESLN